MKIVRELTPEDMVAFNLLAVERSGTYRRAIRNNRIFGIALLFIIFSGCFIISLQYVPPWIGVAISLFSFSVAVVFSESVNSIVIRRRLRKMALESLTPQILAPCTYNFTPEGFTWENPYARGESTWKTVDEVVETEDCLYLFEGKLTAHIFPKRGFESPERIQEFLGLAHRCLSVTHAPNP
jgi:hypothetical protein